MARSLAIPVYSAGTIAVAQVASIWTVTGVGTKFASPDGTSTGWTIAAGDLFVCGGVLGMVAEVASDTSLTLAAWPGAAVSAGASYQIFRLSGMPTAAAVGLVQNLLKYGTADFPWPAFVATIGGRRFRLTTDGSGNIVMQSRLETEPDSAYQTLGYSAGDEMPSVVPASARYIRTDMGSGDATTTLTGVAGALALYPFVPRYDVTTAALGVNCTTGVASALGKVVVYDSDASKRPNALLLETGTLDLSTTGEKEIAASLTMLKGRQYWLGVRHSSTAEISAWQAYTSPSIDAASITPTPSKTLARTLAFGTGAPSSWGYVATENSTGLAPAVWIKTA